MSNSSLELHPSSLPPMPKARAMRLRSIIVGVIGFLTLVDLFATQAILPTLAEVYDVTPSAIGLAVNVCTIGMALSCLGVALISGRLNRRQGIWISLALLAIPTSLLAVAPGLASFAALRIAQGIFMAAAFALTMAYLAEHCSAEEIAGTLAAYVTGVVASNLVGRLVAATVSDLLGVGANFYLFAALNLAGAALVFLNLDRMSPMASPGPARSPLASWADHLNNPALRATFGIGFLTLFAFLGIFTYVNFVLAAAPISLSPMSLGIVYFVFLPSMVTTPLAGAVAGRIGTRPALWGGLAVAAAGLVLLVQPNLVSVLGGMVLVGVGTFFVQALATGFIGRAARSDRAAASGLYLASYYVGGLTGAALLGQLFDRYGWEACVAGVGLALAIAALVTVRLRIDDR
ncbi:Inner membrane transport protein YnfM [Defluviimonas aquaemixtae]|uniref:Inner membrane transport protein YnfM n=1 Tax=Albidovulum aquaemixtae TaxID=1542388 RepID=A0A2R8B4F8_9RHOB|nr:MFS transporter [Defluviimonas aquaemixtae]SPH17509.1 Inner membrane transport protein YnfM [Defluviimonas aquaemixtae]